MRQHLLFASSLGLAALIGSASVSAAPVLRVQVDQRGDFVLIGNALAQDCAVGLPPPVVGTVGACGANTSDSAADVFWRSEAPAAGLAQADLTVTNAQARSTSLLTLPAGASVTHAYLYWGGTVGSGGTADTGAILDRPGGFSQTVTALTTFTGSNASYQSVADVTALVQANGPGAYRVGDVSAVSLANLSSNDDFLGWYMVVLYTNPGDPLRNLALFDGLDLVQMSQPQNITLTGLFVPAMGYTARLGVVTFEGDSTIPGDQLLFNGTALTDAMNPANNFFNGTRSYLGAPVTVVGDLPQLAGTPGSYSGLDMDVVDVTARVQPFDTSATLQASTAGDVFHLAAWVTSISTFKPDFTTTTKSVVDLNGGDVRPGDVLEYTIVVANTGNDTAVNTVLTDPIPSGTTFDPGSIEITAGANVGVKSDAADADQGEVSGSNVVVRLGTGADGNTGGDVLVGEGATVKFRVVVTANSGVLSNQASIAAAGELGAATGTWVSSGSSGVSSPTTLDVDACSTDADCAAPTPACDTVADPHACVECLTDDHCSGLTPQCDVPNETCICIPTGAETCDGDDNDCNGVIDDGFDVGMPCTAGVGACEAEGIIQCVSASASECDATPGTPAAVETCGDDVDANCDGEPSDGCPPPAECQRDFECGAGQVCDAGACISGCRTNISERQCSIGYLCIADEGETLGQCELSSVSTEGGGFPGCRTDAGSSAPDAGWFLLLGLPLALRRRRRSSARR